MIEPESTTEQSKLSGKTEDRRSVFGIASISSGLLACIFLLLEVGVLSFYMKNDPTGKNLPPFLLNLNCWLLPIILPSLAGIVLGVIGLFQKNIKKTTAIIGLILSLMTAVVFCVSLTWLIVMGLSGV